MSTLQSDGTSFCRWVIAKDYYDGELSGIALRRRDHTVIYFRMVAWDSDGDTRLFALAAVEGTLSETLRGRLRGVEPERKPFWLPGRHTDTPEVRDVWEALQSAAIKCQDWRLVEARSLLDPAVEIRLTQADAARVTASVRSETVVTVDTPPLLDAFLRHVREGPA